MFHCEFRLYDSSMESRKTLAKKGKKSYREYYREHVHAQSMNLIKMQEPLEGFKDRKTKPRASMPDEDDEEVPDTLKVLEWRCDTFQNLFPDASEETSSNPKGWYSDIGRAWYICPGPLERW